MHEYASITLSMIEYAGIHLKKQSAEYVRIPNVSDGVHSISPLHKLLSSYRDRHVFRTVKHLKWSVLQKKNIAQPKIFQGKRGRFVELEPIDKVFVKKTPEKETPRENIFEFFLLDILKTTF